MRHRLWGALSQGLRRKGQNISALTKPLPEAGSWILQRLPDRKAKDEKKNK